MPSSLLYILSYRTDASSISQVLVGYSVRPCVLCIAIFVECVGPYTMYASSSKEYKENKVNSLMTYLCMTLSVNCVSMYVYTRSLPIFLRLISIYCQSILNIKMSYAFCLILVVFSVANGSEENSWREEIEKRLSILEESNIYLQKENKELKALVLDAQHENKRLKSELEDIGERVNNCEGFTHRQDEDSERVSQTMESVVGTNDDIVTFYSERNQPIPRIGTLSYP